MRAQGGLVIEDCKGSQASLEPKLNPDRLLDAIFVLCGSPVSTQCDVDGGAGFNTFDLSQGSGVLIALGAGQRVARIAGTAGQVRTTRETKVNAVNLRSGEVQLHAFTSLNAMHSCFKVDTSRIGVLPS